MTKTRTMTLGEIYSEIESRLMNDETLPQALIDGLQQALWAIETYLEDHDEER